jgi:glycosyltransferase involved in cell wall biosynthesis
VAHAPSVAAYKGTAWILPTLERLQQEGVIEFRLIQGVPSKDMPSAFADADVVIDQFRAGSYGVAACEAMAAGCVVVGQVSDQVRSTVYAETGTHVPIVEATPDSLEQTLRKLAEQEDFDGASARSVAFVNEVHDGRRAARALLENWIIPTSKRKDTFDATGS